MKMFKILFLYLLLISNTYAIESKHDGEIIDSFLFKTEVVISKNEIDLYFIKKDDYVNHKEFKIDKVFVLRKKVKVKITEQTNKINIVFDDLNLKEPKEIYITVIYKQQLLIPIRINKGKGFKNEVPRSIRDV